MLKSLYKNFIFTLPIILSLMLISCEEETTTIGSVISKGEVEITIDTLYFNLNAKPVEIETFDSKTGNLMVGNIQLKDYGNLSCSFVTRLLCVPNLQVPDSLFTPERVDSCKLIMGADRSDIVGDSLAPQRLTVYKLTRQLPSDINNAFNPDGYYDASQPFASKSYTLSEIASNDSVFYNNSYVELTVDLPVEFGKEIFEKYKSDPEIFSWPQTMAEKFLPGLFIKSTFGNGNIANIFSIYTAVFYHHLADAKKVENGDTIAYQKHVTNVVFPFSVSPEVLSSNNITYSPSQNIIEKNEEMNGQVVLTTPGGYITTFDFPAQTLIDRYLSKNEHLSTVNDLVLFIPAEPFDKSGEMPLAQNLLMIKSSEYENFFKENRTPDNITSFTGVYDSKNGRYYFTTMRSYFLDLLKKDSITQEDTEFTIIPVEITTETEENIYGNGSTYVTKCVPYTAKPTLTLLKTDEAMTIFSFSTQIIE